MTKEDPYSFEEEFHSREKQESRKERKLAIAKDRSKYKKSDQDQLKKRAEPVPEESLLRGRVLSITVEGVKVKSGESFYLCSLRGVLKKETSQLKNLVAVGDFVRFLPKGEGEGVIYSLEERQTILSRADNLSRKKEQLIAVNISQVYITTSVISPPLKPFLIDRYIIATEKGGMTPLIVVNKIDLLDNCPPGMERTTWELAKTEYAEFKATYSLLGFPFYEVSASSGAGLEALKKSMEGKTSVFSGQSGVGKSSLINAILGTEISVGALSSKTMKGSHTTTTTQLIPLEGEGFCIDTPGITSFGLWKLEPHEVSAYFPDIAAVSQNCKFPDCTHLKEPGCAVQQALETGGISSLRFASYYALMMSLEAEHKNR